MSAAMIVGILVAAAVPVVAGAFLQDGAAGDATTRPAYPEAEKSDVVEDYHGTKVADPYRWLEAPNSPQTRDFIDAQNVITRQYLDSPVREQIRARLEELVDYPRTGTPSREADRLLFSRNSGLQNQDVLYTKLQGQDEARVLLDPNSWSEDGTVALAYSSVSDDGQTLVYGVSEGGSDDRVFRIMDLREGRLGEHYPEELAHMRFSGVAWNPDGSGFWYNKYPDPGTVPPEEERLDNKIFWHTLETPQENDRELFAYPEDPELSFWPYVTPNGRYFLLYASRGTDRRSGIRYRDVCCDPGMAGGFTELFPPQEAQYSVVDDPGDGSLVVLTDRDAPAFRLVKIDLANPEPEHWETILPEPSEPGTILSSVTRAGDRYVAEYMQDANSVLKHYDLEGGDEQTIELPTLGSVGTIEGSPEHDDIFFSFTSFTYPSTPFRYDLETGELEKFADNSPKGFDPEAYETKQVFYESKDGTKVPMFITHKKGLTLDGSNPTILYGYGGFNVSMTPGFSSSRLAWLEQGGVYAVANLRGGGEYGQAWHEQGMFEKKQNVFDDFIAAAEYLVDEGYTSSDKLAIQGGSNGGLLTAATVLQRPDLFGAVHSSVPVIDMLRYHTYGTGRFWTVEYGNAVEDAEAFDYLMEYSPLHNVEENANYPPILVTTGDGDDRVVPAHSLKWIATLQEKSPDSWPMLLRYDVGSGHGAGKPISKALDEAADVYAFFAKALGVEWQRE